MTAESGSTLGTSGERRLPAVRHGPQWEATSRWPNRLTESKQHACKSLVRLHHFTAAHGRVTYERQHGAMALQKYKVTYREDLRIAPETFQGAPHVTEAWTTFTDGSGVVATIRTETVERIDREA
jgi:hypothetical protein